MKLYKIAALIYADLMLLRNSKWKIVEYVYFPLTTVIIWGLFSAYVGYAAEAGIMLLVANIIWNFAYQAQSHVNMQINEDSWSGSMKQIIASGVSDFEYLTARIISATFTSLLILVVMISVSIVFFGASIFMTKWEIFAMLIFSTLVASIGLSIFVAGGMIALGREYGFMAWTILQLFIVLSAPFYPISVYPDFMQSLVSVMPYTYVFEATRSAVSGAVNMTDVTNSIYVAFAYLLLSIPFYKFIFKKALQKGWLVRLG